MINEQIVETVLEHYPQTEAIYLFGSFGTEHLQPDSDADIALLLPPRVAREAGTLAMSALRVELESLLGRNVDLINLREVSTVFQKEIILEQRRIYCAELHGVENFEILILSLYQRLNEERAGILQEGLRSGRFYQI